MARPLLLLFLLAFPACGGSSPSPSSSPTPIQPVDAAIARLWSGWAASAEQIASVMQQMYASGNMFRDLLTARSVEALLLAEEIRGQESSSELSLRLADDLEELGETLEFAIEYSNNAGAPNVGGIFIPGLAEAIDQISEDAGALRDVSQTR